MGVNGVGQIPVTNTLVMVSFHCQLITAQNWEKNLNEGLSRSGRSVAMSVGDCLIVLNDMGHSNIYVGRTIP